MALNETVTHLQNLTNSADYSAFWTVLPRLSADGFMSISKPLLLYIVGMTFYGIFIFKFYRFLAKRDILKLKTSYYDRYEGLLKKMFKFLFYVLENLILIPILIFFWFGVLTLFLLMLGKNNTASIILISSASIVGAVRITSYYDEALSQDLAKMIPFTLLGVFLIDMNTFSIDKSIDIATEIPKNAEFLYYFLGFVVAVEFIMRIGHGIYTRLFWRRIERLRKEREEINPSTEMLEA